MKRELASVLLASTLLGYVATAQDVYSEAIMFSENGILKSTRIVVGFKENVIPTDQGVDTVDLEMYSIMNQDVQELVDDLTAIYGPIVIRKTIPDAVWGDTLVQNIRTGEWVSLLDMSQSFRFDFSTAVPIDSIIELFRAMPVVEYADRPICVMSLLDPNDPYYVNQSQWNLYKIDASHAWNIRPKVCWKYCGSLDQQ